MEIEQYRQRLKCSVPQVDDIFAGCIAEALDVMSESGVDAYLDGASKVCGLGRGTDLPIIFLENIPSVVKILGEEIIPDIVAMTRFLSGALLPKAIAPFLDSLPSCARKLKETPLMLRYFQIVEQLAENGGTGLVPMLHHIDAISRQISIEGLQNWVNYGLKAYREQPHKLGEYFGLQSADAHAALQRERNGTLLLDSERKLNLYLRSFWGLEEELHPYSIALDPRKHPLPHLDKTGFHLPDVCEDFESVAGLDLYRAILAHLAAHRLWTRPIIADNYNRYQHLFIEAFEDSRIEWLAMRRYPGLRRLWMKLHPQPIEGECPSDHSSIRHKMALLSRAILDPDHPYTDPLLLEYVEKFLARVKENPHDPALATELGVAYLAAVHEPGFRLPRVWFKDTEMAYRDDNRYLWIFLEDTDEDDFHSDHSVANPKQENGGDSNRFARHHQEWDYLEQCYRPDWVTVFEAEQREGDPALIDHLLEVNKPITKRLKRIVDLLKPQQLIRIRHQEDGAELDLDTAIRSIIDYRAGITPDPRIHVSHKHDGRDISVMLLIDLSQSINERPGGLEKTVLELSQEAVTLLAWAIDAIGDPFAIAGFASNTRHDVRYLHFKGFDEPWGTDIKARLAGMEGALSTRMGSALRHAGHYLSLRRSSRKLLLVLTDGEPSDIDVDDVHYLRNDTRKAVEELSSKRIHPFCISLDPDADEYVADIFGKNGFAVIDHVARLPEKLPQLFLSLTK